MGRAFPSLASTCRARNLHFNEVDLRWGIQAGLEEPAIIATCLQASQFNPFGQRAFSPALPLPALAGLILVSGST